MDGFRQELARHFQSALRAQTEDRGNARPGVHDSRRRPEVSIGADRLPPADGDQPRDRRRSPDNDTRLGRPCLPSYFDNPVQQETYGRRSTIRMTEVSRRQTEGGLRPAAETGGGADEQMSDIRTMTPARLGSAPGPRSGPSQPRWRLDVREPPERWTPASTSRANCLTRTGSCWAQGIVGRDVEVETARGLARQAALNALAVAAQAVGDLDRVRIVQMLVFVASTPELGEQSRVADAASESPRRGAGRERTARPHRDRCRRAAAEQSCRDPDGLHCSVRSCSRSAA